MKQPAKDFLNTGVPEPGEQRKLWNANQKLLRQAFQDPATHTQAIELFLKQHAAVHARDMANLESWTFVDDLYLGLDDSAWRSIPPGNEHSVAWLVWHMARIEDVTMNMLLAGGDQVLIAGDWVEKLSVPYLDTGNQMADEDIQILSRMVDIDTLKDYRTAVGRRTREQVQKLEPDQLKLRVDPYNLRRLLAEGAVVQSAGDLISYWSGLTLAGLLLMPPTRHNFIHLNEAARIKYKLNQARK